MQKSLASALFGLMLIVIIIESTSLSSSLPVNQSVTDLSPALFSPVITSAPADQLMPLQPEPVMSPVSPANDTTPIENTSPDNAALPPGGNSMTAVGDSPLSVNSLPSLVPGLGYVQYDDPLPDGDNNISDFLRAVIMPVPTLPPVDMVEIFHQNQVYTYNTTAISFHLKNPPMDIEFNVTPMDSTDTKWVPNRDIQKPVGAPDGRILSVTRPDQNSWFRITVLDKANNGSVVQKEGFGGIYDLTTAKEIHIREAGYYQIQLDGGYIGADTRIFVPREGNII